MGGGGGYFVTFVLVHILGDKVDMFTTLGHMISVGNETKRGLLFTL